MLNRDFGGAPGTNPPRHQLSPRQKRSSFTAWIAGLVVLVALIVGGVMYFTRAEQTTTAANTPSAEPSAPPAAPLTPQTMPAPKK
jgi:flagellar basal body-associated protein FliL